MGCKHPGCTDPASSAYDPKANADDGSCVYPSPTLSVHFNHVVGNQPFSMATIYTDSNGKRFQFTTARFYASSPVLVNSSGNTSFNKYIHVLAGRDSTYVLGNIVPGVYTGFQFDLGIDSAANHNDPTLFADDHALSPLSQYFDHWSWNVGYVFLKIIGVTDTSASQNGALDFGWEMHIATEPLLRRIPLVKEVAITEGQAAVVHVRVDWSKALSGFNYHRSTHTTDQFVIAERAMNNLVSGITIE